MLRVLDLFSGIGGFSLGLERTGGFKTVAFCEIAPKCRHLLNHHWPEVPTYDDVCTLTADRLRADGIAVDAICGGFPCQDISFAGAGAGIEGERSGLWAEYARLIRELRPRLVFVENVSALLARGLGRVLGDLASVGYSAWWDCIPASAVGAPHRRDRLWLVAYPGSLEHQGYGDALRRAVAAELSRAAVADTSGGRARRRGQGPSAQPVRGGAARAAHVGDAGSAAGQWDAGSLPGEEAPEHRAWLEDGRRPDGPELAGAGDLSWWWLTEPNVGRVAHGVPARVDRLHGLGNAVVPEIPYRLGKAVLSAEAHVSKSEAA